jgi:hypothetical protein
MARRGGRRAGKKTPGRRICIVTEGHVTEREYLEALRTRLGISKDLVRIDYTAGYTDIVSLARYAIRKAGNRREPFEEWWVVGDSEQDERAVMEARALVTSHNDVHIAISRPCFEVWPLLHLRQSTRPYNTPTECQRDLDVLLPGYLKGKKHLRPSRNSNYMTGSATAHGKVPYASSRSASRLTSH